jgi:endonuclease/exonuclease/phosphatase family metal-dependent hydrolase
MQQRFTRVSCGSPITHRWNLQLDYMFATSAALFSACDRPADRFDSDHHPLVARLHLNPGP